MLFVLIGLLVWICRLVTLDSLTAGFWTMALTLVNSLLITRYVSKVGWTNLPSAFVVSTVWMLLSVLSMWQLCWQVHLVVLMFTIVGVVLVRMNIQEEAREQAYGLALLCCILSPHYIVSSGAQSYHMACDGGMVVGYRYLCVVWRYCALFGLVRSLLVRAFAYAAMAVVDDRTRQLSMGGTNGVYADSQSLCLLGCAVCSRYHERPDNSRMANVADVCLIKISMNIIV